MPFRIDEMLLVEVGQARFPDGTKFETSTPISRVVVVESFPARLQARLNRDGHAASPWQVINAGVPGYTSFQLRLLAQRLVPRWRPEVLMT